MRPSPAVRPWAGSADWEGVRARVRRSELRLKDIERMENSVADLRAREKRPQFTKDMKEELVMSEKILTFLKEGTDVRSGAQCRVVIRRTWLHELKPPHAVWQWLVLRPIGRCISATGLLQQASATLQYPWTL